MVRRPFLGLAVHLALNVIDAALERLRQLTPEHGGRWQQQWQPTRESYCAALAMEMIAEPTSSEQEYLRTESSSAARLVSACRCWWYGGGGCGGATVLHAHARVFTCTRHVAVPRWRSSAFVVLGTGLPAWC